MKVKKHLITIIIPAYNAAGFILNALNSIASQITPPDYEILIIDDHSTDNTLDIVNTYAKNHPEIKVLSNTRTKGVAGARNTGFENAQGVWITFLDSDDTWEPDNLSSFYEAILNYPESDIFISDRYETIAPQEKKLLTETDPVWHKYFISANKKQSYLRLENPADIFFEEGVLMRTGICMIRRKLIEEIGYCDEELKAAVDMSWFFILAANVDHMIYIPKPLMNYYHRVGSLTHTIPFGFFGVPAYKKLLKHPDLHTYRQSIRKQIALWSLDKTYYYRKNNKKIKAIISAFESVWYEGKNKEYWKHLIASILLR